MSKSDDCRAKVLEVLNKARSMELYAIHQYMQQHFTLDDEDYGQLASKMKKIAIDEMKHAEAFAERIKDLGGEVTSEPAGKIVKGQTTKDIYGFDTDVEDDTVAKYNEFIKVCRDNNDAVSENLFLKIINVEQEHLNYFGDTDNHIKTLKDSFLSKMSTGEAD